MPFMCSVKKIHIAVKWKILEYIEFGGTNENAK